MPGLKDRMFIDADRCVGCGLCVSVCARKLIVVKRGKAFVAEPGRCSGCGHCQSVCPENALRIPGCDPEGFVDAPSAGELPSPAQLLLFLRNRRSIRLFTGQAVARETAMSIIDAGRCAPTAQNRQALCYSVVLGGGNVEELRSLAISVLLEQADILENALNEEKRNPGVLSAEERRFKDYPSAWRFMAELRKKGIDPLFHDAPAVTVCHVDPLVSLHPEVEAGMAMMQMALMTESMGLGSCFCALLDYAVGHSPAIKTFLGIPSGHISPVSFMLGYPAIRYRRLPARRPAVINWL